MSDRREDVILNLCPECSKKETLMLTSPMDLRMHSCGDDVRMTVLDDNWQLGFVQEMCCMYIQQGAAKTSHTTSVVRST